MNKMVIYAGYNGKERLNDTYEFDLDKKTWALIDPSKSESTPSARDCHSAVLYKHYMILFGGGDGYKWLNDMHSYDIINQQWKEIHPKDKSLVPAGRAGHSAIVHQNKMVVFAGWNGRKTMNDLHEFDLETCNWKTITPKGQVMPQSRDSHCAVVYQGKMYILGGGDGKNRLNDMYEYDIASETWTKVFYLGEVNAARAGHVACQFNDKLIIFGGGDGVKWLTDIFQFDFSEKKWYMVENTGEVAPGSYGLSAVVHKNKCIMFGGGDGRQWYNSIYEYTCDEEKNKKVMKENMWKIASQKKSFMDCSVMFKHEMEHEMYYDYFGMDCDMLVEDGGFCCPSEVDEKWILSLEPLKTRRAMALAASAGTPSTPTSRNGGYRWFSTSSMKTLVNSRTPMNTMSGTLTSMGQKSTAMTTTTTTVTGANMVPVHHHSRQPSNNL